MRCRKRFDFADREGRWLRKTGVMRRLCGAGNSSLGEPSSARPDFRSFKQMFSTIGPEPDRRGAVWLRMRMLFEKSGKDAGLIFAFRDRSEEQKSELQSRQ